MTNHKTHQPLSQAQFELIVKILSSTAISRNQFAELQTAIDLGRGNAEANFAYTQKYLPGSEVEVKIPSFYPGVGIKEDTIQEGVIEGPHSGRDSYRVRMHDGQIMAVHSTHIMEKNT